MSDARRGELPGVQVGDVLHHFVEGVDVLPLHAQGRLVGVELHLRRWRRETLVVGGGRRWSQRFGWGRVEGLFLGMTPAMPGVSRGDR